MKQNSSDRRPMSRLRLMSDQQNGHKHFLPHIS